MTRGDRERGGEGPFEGFMLGRSAQLFFFLSWDGLNRVEPRTRLRNHHTGISAFTTEREGVFPSTLDEYSPHHARDAVPHKSRPIAPPPSGAVPGWETCPAVTGRWGEDRAQDQRKTSWFGRTISSMGQVDSGDSPAFAVICFFVLFSRRIRRNFELWTARRMSRRQWRSEVQHMFENGNSGLPYRFQLENPLRNRPHGRRRELPQVLRPADRISAGLCGQGTIMGQSHSLFLNMQSRTKRWTRSKPSADRMANSGQGLALGAKNYFRGRKPVVNVN